jgi:AraC-like DNA-binding protein
MNGSLASHLNRARAADLALPADYVRLLGEQLRDMRIDDQRWLERHELSWAQVEDPAFAVKVPVFRALVADALALSGEPALGLMVGERLVVHTHGLLGMATLNCTSLRQVVELFEHYIGLRTPLVSIRHDVRGANVRIICRERLVLGEIRRPVLEAITLALKNMLDFVALGQQPVRQVSYPFDAPAYVNLVQDILRCDVRYRSGWTGLTVPLELFDQPLKKVDPADFGHAALACARELGSLVERDALKARVRRLLLDKGTTGFPSLKVTARLLHMTPRTLHRNLVHQGTSFRQILEGVRHTLAVQHLQAGKLSVEGIARALGYTETANFRRAFKRWEGLSPSACRERQQS